ncbi:MAG: hypothetical protein Q9220_003561 [cf. Caloplaca sp. 1 TL-2023]
MPPGIILPAIAPLTASATSAIVCVHGKLSARAQVPMIVTGYVFLGFGLADAVGMIIIYLSRLLNGGFPGKAQIWMNYILVGPLGQASAAMQLLGQAASAPGNKTFAAYNKGTFLTASAGQVLGTVGVFADGGIRKYSLSAWSSVFPWGVFALAAIELGKDMNSPAFDALSSGPEVSVQWGEYDLQALRRTAHESTEYIVETFSRKAIVQYPPNTRLLFRPSKFFICKNCIAKSRRRLFSAATTPPSTSIPTQSLPPPPPSEGIARLENRALISIGGPDVAHFLQGLTTSNIKTSSSSGFFSAFLNAQGRVLHDVFIYPTSHSLDFREKFGGDGVGRPFYLIDVDKVHAELLRAHLRRFKLRAKFQMRVLEPGECDVWGLWGRDNDGNTGTGGDAALKPQPNPTIGCIDSRAPGMGRRIITLNSHKPHSEASSSSVKETSNQTYDIRRILHGVPQGHSEILTAESLPQESNIDYMGGIDFRKGCYVGQELTIRTHHTGVVRKRILPVRLYATDEKAPEELRYDPTTSSSLLLGESLPVPGTTQNIARVGTIGRGRSAGKLLMSVGNVGLALCRLEVMTDVRVTEEGSSWSPEQEFKVAWKPGDGGGGGGDREKEVKIKAFVPEWHRNRATVRDMHGKVNA